MNKNVGRPPKYSQKMAVYGISVPVEVKEFFKKQANGQDLAREALTIYMGILKGGGKNDNTN